MSFSLAKLSARSHAGGFSIWSYETADDLTLLLEPIYFLPAAGILRPADLLFSSCTTGGKPRTVLLRVVAVEHEAIHLDPVRDAAVANLADLGDVAAQRPQRGDVLKFDGAAWAGGPEAGPRGDAFAEMHTAAGGDAHPLARADGAGFMSASDKVKLEGIEAGASADQSGAEIVAALDAELRGSNWRRDDIQPHTHAAADLENHGDFYGKALGPSLLVDGDSVGVDPAVLSRSRAITAPVGDDPAVGLELPAAMDRRDFLLGFTATGAVTTTKVATAKDIDSFVSRGFSNLLIAEEVSDLEKLGDAKVGEAAFVTDPRRGGYFISGVSGLEIDGGVVMGHLHATQGFRWTRSFSNMPNLSWWDNPAKALKWITQSAGRPISFFAPRGRYDFTGLQLPLGVSFFGDGAGRDPGDEGTIFTASGERVVQSGGGDRFQVYQGLSFPDGLEIRKQHTRLQDCLIDGKGLWLEGNGYSPYHIVVDNCRLYAAAANDCVTLNKTVNACTFSNNSIATRGGRCIHIRQVDGFSGSMNVFLANAIEKMYTENVVSAPSFVRCDGDANTFIGNYIDASVPVFTEGGLFVFADKAKNNRIFPTGQKTETFNLGYALRNRIERTGPELFRKAGGTLSIAGYEAQYYVVDSATTGGIDLPPASSTCWSTRFFLLHIRDTPQVVRASSGEDINYLGNTITVPADAIAVCVPHGGVRWLITVLGYENGQRVDVDELKVLSSYTTTDQDSGKHIPIHGAGDSINVLIHKTAKPGFFATFRQAGPARINFMTAGGVGTLLHVDGHRRSRGINSIVRVIVEANGVEGPRVLLDGDTGS